MDSHMALCPVCTSPWTNMIEIDGETYVYHRCDRAKAYIGWTSDRLPKVIADEFVYVNPPDHTGGERYLTDWGEV